MKINHRENMKAALECRQPETAVPVWELEFQAWDNVSGKHVILGREFEKLTAKEQVFAMNNNAEIMISVAQELNFSALTLVVPFWEVAPGTPSYYWLPESSREKQNKILQKHCETVGIMTVAVYGAGVVGALITMPGTSSNYAEFCYWLHDKPEEVDEYVKKNFEKGVEVVKRFGDLGYDIVLSASDIADNKGPFFNPVQLDRWFYPYLGKWTETIKSLGMYSILHTDGNIYSMLDNLADSGLNALQSIDPIAGMDIIDVKNKVKGRLCLCGNVESGLVLTGPKESIFDSARKVLEGCKEGGGLVFGSSNAIVPETPAENYRMMTRAWEDYGKY